MNVNGKYLKDETGKVISPITSVDTIFKNNTKLLDLIYPVGSYYETSNPDFNPNTSWGGTWNRHDTEGYVTVGATETPQTEVTDRISISEGVVIGEVYHTLTVDEIPSHRHQMFTYMIGGSSTGGGYNLPTVTNATRTDFRTQYVGGGQGHYNVQPSIGVYRWHRTA